MTFIYNLNELSEVVTEILKLNNLKKIITFHADMGVGKTTIIKEFSKQLGSQNHSSSPTFSLVNEYEIGTNEKIYHFDLYRIKDEMEAYDMGIDEYFYSGNWCFIEWPEKIPHLIPLEHASITINLLPNGKRELIVKND